MHESLDFLNNEAMEILAKLFVGIVAIVHIYILVLEMFLYTKPIGMKAFRQTPESAKTTSVMMANQGLYNGFLAAGLIWSLFHPVDTVAAQLQIFFLLCVAVAGLYGAYSANKRILFIQAMPALIGLGFVLASS